METSPVTRETVNHRGFPPITEDIPSSNPVMQALVYAATKDNFDVQSSLITAWIECLEPNLR